jgi:hypothetical protein
VAVHRDGVLEIRERGVQDEPRILRAPGEKLAHPVRRLAGGADRLAVLEGFPHELRGFGLVRQLFDHEHGVKEDGRRGEEAEVGVFRGAVFPRENAQARRDDLGDRAFLEEGFLESGHRGVVETVGGQDRDAAGLIAMRRVLIVSFRVPAMLSAGEAFTLEPRLTGSKSACFPSAGTL